MTATQVAAVIRGFRFRYRDEAELHEGIARTLVAAGYQVDREVRLGARDRIDFLVGAVGIEVKVAGRAASVARQLMRYAESEEIDELVLVTNRAAHLSSVPVVALGKPVVTVRLRGALA